jgi:hypothetical protein
VLLDELAAGVAIDGPVPFSDQPEPLTEIV